MRRTFSFWILVAAASCLFPSCSFDYGSSAADALPAMPDVVMTEVEYVRVRDGKAVVRLQAESVERYEKDRRMVAKAPRFAQFAADGSDGAVGGASSAVVDLASGDVSLYGGVTLSVPDEKMIIETEELFWKDGDRILFGAAGKPVLVKKSDGSFLSGIGFSADARKKTWELSGQVSGALVEEDEKEEEPIEPDGAEADEAESEDPVPQ